MDFGFKKSGVHTLIEPYTKHSDLFEKIMYFGYLESHYKACIVLNKALETDLQENPNEKINNTLKANQLYQENVKKELQKVGGLVLQLSKQE